ncbi:hypothetical protein N1851_007098 [Merluccius polli]|uniref:Uncharacterized protein n=1 Tax=Merluccius polli TaxID=89951 RepID=A0AA47N4L3_MERPO|nr:hypothetical protein N1851_007098 [Merluccius polli]
MASPAKRSRTEEEDFLVGYVHSPSPTKTSKKNTRYFDATIQTGREEYHRVVVFSPQKRQAYEQAALAKTPVKLTHKNSRYFDATLQTGRQEYHRLVVFGPEKHKVFEQAAIAKTPVKLDPNGFDVLCSTGSNVQVVDNLQFFFRAPPTAGTMTVASVLALGPKQHINAVRVKILPGGIQSKLVPVDGVMRELKQFRVCDPTGVTRLTMWEDKILLVELSHSYEIRNVTTRRCGEQTVLTSTPSTTLNEIQDVGEPDKLEPYGDGGDLAKVCGRVSAVQIGAKHHCVRCRASQAQFSCKCTSHRCERCRMLQRAESYRVLYSGTVVVVSDGQENTATLTNSALSRFVAEHMGGVATDSEAIEAKLISVDEVELEVNSSQVVMSLTLGQGTGAAGEQAQGSEVGLTEEVQLAFHSFGDFEV